MFVVSNVLYPAVHKLGTLSKLLIFDTARLETLKLQHMREIEYAKKTFFFLSIFDYDRHTNKRLLILCITIPNTK